MFDGVQAQLTVQDAVCADEGSYSCVAENEYGRAVCSARVLVKGMSVLSNIPTLSTAQQKIYKKNSNKTIEVFVIKTNFIMKKALASETISNV